MDNRFYFGILTAFLLLAVSCKNSDNKQKSAEETAIPAAEKVVYDEAVIAPEYKKNPKDFIPEGYVLFEKKEGDLNKDGVADCILIIKGTDKSKFFKHEYQGLLDRNRRGIIILFNTKDGYELATKNYDCFSSENEEGGAYFAPELDVSAEKGNLYIHYGHGRYGYWTYTFKFKNSDFELIGYDSSDNMGPLTISDVSINYLTKKKLKRVNLNQDDPDADEVFKETWSRIKTKDLIKLSQIIDFDELEVDE